MKRFAWVLAIAGLTMTPFAVLAQDGKEVTVSSKDCRRLVRHYPDADVAYKPGVDVRGNPVASADLAGSRLKVLPDKLTIPITADLLNGFGIADDSPFALEGETRIGTVEYDINKGTMTYNGQPLGDPEQQALAAACAAAGKK